MNVLKIAGMVASAVGLVAGIAESIIKEKQMHATIAKEVAKAVAKANK